jgi:acyl-CoA synthetase (AMP-forming)/AMP-acid ligase II
VEGQPEGIGEIVLYGSSVSPDHTDKGLFTGDLGFMQDGELYICGRLKEVVILNGKKYLFHEIEDFVETLPFVHDRGALAAALEEDGIESLVLFVELRRDALSKDLRNEQKARIIRLLNREFGITPVDIRFFPPASLPKSSSGKKSRLPFALLASDTNI